MLRGKLIFMQASNSTKDISLKIDGVDKLFYINRGMEKPDALALFNERNELYEKEITLGYPTYWTPLDWNNRHKHICYVEIQGEERFVEWE